MKYLPPFEVLKSLLTISNIKGELMVSCPYENIVQMLRQVIIGVEVDEQWYLERYPDIAEAIANGQVQSARLHFVNDGYFEGRMPFPIHVDERYYLSQNRESPSTCGKACCNPASSISTKTATPRGACRSAL